MTQHLAPPSPLSPPFPPPHVWREGEWKAVVVRKRRKEGRKEGRNGRKKRREKRS